MLDRETQQRAKVLSNMVKQKRKEKAGKWDVPLPKGNLKAPKAPMLICFLVRAQAEAEVFKMVTSGKRGKKAWKRMVSFLLPG